MLEDYRAGLTVDRRHEDADWDAGRRLQPPLLVLWSKRDDLEESKEHCAMEYAHLGRTGLVVSRIALGGLKAAQGGGRRERTVLATKLYQPQDDWPNHGRLSALHIRDRPVSVESAAPRDSRRDPGRGEGGRAA